MSELYTTGTWTVTAGSEDAFVEAWSAFAGWASSMEGAGTLRLAQDLQDSGRFVSFGRWESDDAVRSWKGGPEFRDRITQVLQHVDNFEPAELSLVAVAKQGSTAVAA